MATIVFRDVLNPFSEGNSHLGVQTVLAELKQERDRLAHAISVLEGLDKGGHKAPGRGRHARRHMSADARARISKAMKLRWAQRKKKTT